MSALDGRLRAALDYEGTPEPEDVGTAGLEDAEPECAACEGSAVDRACAAGCPFFLAACEGGDGGA